MLGELLTLLPLSITRELRTSLIDLIRSDLALRTTLSLP